jgi:hypothetical protein
MPGMRLGRILTVTAALALLGALGGALGGLLLFGLVGLVVAVLGVPMNSNVGIWQAIAVASAAGGVCGILAAPILSWTVLREVPIWRSAGETALVAGFSTMAALVLLAVNPLVGLAVPISATMLAAARLRWSYRRRRNREAGAAPNV